MILPLKAVYKIQVNLSSEPAVKSVGIQWASFPLWVLKKSQIKEQKFGFEQ